ncbi:MAG: DUF1854 domain-containing protein, partial [Planctomycetaceae bacterium]|nr:DUF1854 domain-containing protein [Planctomycetaceae bacterium]
MTVDTSVLAAVADEGLDCAEITPPAPEPILSQATDIDLFGAPADEVIRLFPGGVLAVEAGEAERRRIRVFPLASDTCLRLEAAVGSLFLQIQIAGIWHDVARFTNGHSPAARQLFDRLRSYQKTGGVDATNAVPERAEQALLAPSNATTTRHSCAAQTLRRVWSAVTPYRSSALILVGLSLVTVVIDLAPPMLQRIMVDDVLKVGQGRLDTRQLLFTLTILVVGLALFRVVGTLLAIAKGQLASVIGTALTADLRSKLVRKLQALPIAFHDRHQVGSLMSRVAYDTESMHMLIHQLANGFILQLLQLGGIGIMLFWLNPKLAFFTLLPTPLVLAGSWFFTRYLHPRHHGYWEAVGNQAAALAGMLSGIRVVKAFTQEEREFRRFEVSSQRLRNSRRMIDRSTVTFSSLLGLAFSLGGIIVWHVGGQDVLASHMSLGALTAFLAYLVMFYAPLATVAESATWFSNFLTASERIFDLLELPVPSTSSGQVRSSTVHGHVVFKNVSFCYQEHEPILRNVSLEIMPGEMVGIVGRSGSGKSTLVNLIARLYDIQEGQILIDGVDIRDLDLHALRSTVGMVLQEPFLFRGSIHENLGYGKPDASPEAIIAAARFANAHDFIMRRPFGYESLVGEGGTGLSVGERQRISIARALLYDPKVLILDEATSSVDTESERAIQEAIRRFSRGRTTIAVAHRLSTLEDADRLLVFDQGRLTESGTHDELLERGGIYSSLVKVQRPGSRSLDEGLNHHEITAASLSPDADDDEREPTRDWLDPGAVIVEPSPHGLAPQVIVEGVVWRQVSVLRAFPATHAEAFLSLRGTDDQSREREIGLIRQLSEWSDSAQHALRQALARRYHWRRIVSIDHLDAQGTIIQCDVTTIEGRARLRVDAARDGFRPFGRHGRLLVDVHDNLFVIPDLERL